MDEKRPEFGRLLGENQVTFLPESVKNQYLQRVDGMRAMERGIIARCPAVEGAAASRVGRVDCGGDGARCRVEESQARGAPKTLSQHRGGQSCGTSGTDTAKTPAPKGQSSQA
jgi:hypothetical protein